ncbi:unnamed protein product [Leuciscus chuanchicus]
MPQASGSTQTQLELVHPLSAKRKEDITKGIVHYIAQDMRPVNTVEGECFENMFKIVEPRYTVPAQETVMRALRSRFDGLKVNVNQLLQSSEAVGLTTDLWSSLRMEAYMTVTAHFIDADWKMNSVVLETKQMDEAHTGENVAVRLTQVADAYHIPPEKRVSVVTDNTANMVLSVELLKGIRSVARRGVEDPVSRTVAVARCLVGHFKKGHKAKTGLKKKQVQQKAPEHELIQDVATRWNSTCFMLEQRWPITAVLSDPNYTKRSDSSTLDMTTKQWNMAEDITDVLKPFITLTELLSEETNTSLSAAFPMLENLKKLLDPRFKQLPFLNDEKRDEAYSEVVKLAQRLSLSGDSAEQTGDDEDSLAKKLKTVKEKEIAMLLCGHGAEDDPDEPSAQRSSCDEMKDYLQDIKRIFSKAGFIVNKSRSCLLPKNVDMLVFLAHNIKKVD